MQNRGKYSAPAGREGHTLSLLVSCSESSGHYSGDQGHFHISLSAITLTAENKPRNISDWDSPVVTPRGSFQLGNFQIRSQGARKDAPRTAETKGADLYGSRHLYGFQVEYTGYHTVRLKTAEEIVKTLRTVEKRLEKAQYEQGYPATYAEYVRRVADALGVNQITWLVAKGGNGHTYDDNVYRTVGVEAGCLFIEAVETAWMAGKNGDELPLRPVQI